MTFQDERMLKMMEQLPQNKETGYNAVVPIVEWEFSQTGDPIKDRKKEHQKCHKSIETRQALVCSPRFRVHTILGRAQWKYSDGNRCVIDGADCSALDYGELWDEYFRDPATGAIRPFRPWTGVLPGKGTQLSEHTALNICNYTIY